jgi:hypothetical protein
MTRPLIFLPVFLLTVNSSLYAENRQPHLLDLKFKQETLYGIDVNNSLQENEKVYRRNQRFLRNALQSYSQQTLSFIGLPDQAARVMGATIGFVTHGAKLDLNDSKTLTIELKDMVTHEPVLYFGYDLNW